MDVTDYIARFRQGRVRNEMPNRFLKPGVTVRDAIENGDPKVKKLLVDHRFADPKTTK
jgi:hypothetical protein